MVRLGGSDQRHIEMDGTMQRVGDWRPEHAACAMSARSASDDAAACIRTDPDRSSESHRPRFLTQRRPHRAGHDVHLDSQLETVHRDVARRGVGVNARAQAGSEGSEQKLRRSRDGGGSAAGPKRSATRSGGRPRT